MNTGLRHSVRGKLMQVVLITTVIALCVAGISMLTFELNRYRKSWISDLSTESAILSVSLAPALAFDDHDTAVRDLDALKLRPRVQAAALYTSGGAIFGSFERGGRATIPNRAPPVGLKISGQRVELTQRIERNGEFLGTLYLQARYDIVGRVEEYLGIFAIATLLSMGIALLLSQRLQRRIIQPLDDMALIANAIVKRRDYSLRAKKASEDEIGVVVDAFNSMLDEVGARARALEQSNLALSEEIEVRKTTQAALSLATTRLESTMAAAEIGTWLWDLKKNEVIADRNLAALYGLEDEHALSGSPELQYRHIHPDDLESVKQSEQSAMATGALASTEFRVILADGSEKWMARRGKVQLDEGGEAVFISGLLIDITAQKEAEKALRASEKLYRAIGESISYGVWVCDKNGRNVYVSESYLSLIGMTQTQYAELGWDAVLHPSEAPEVRESWLECIRSGSPWYRELRVRGADDRHHWVLSQGVPIKGDDGEISAWAGINLDIGRLKLTEEALRDADRRKDEFLATLAHELRNPLAPIRHAAKVLDSTVIDAENHKWAREVITRQVQRMALLLEDLLDVSRITQGRLSLKIETVPLTSVVEAAVETARPLIESKKHKLVIDIPVEPVLFNVDPLRLSQSLANLLTNSAKYTDAGGVITLAATVTDDEIRLAVRDTGIGFALDTLPALFEMFSQANAAITRSEGGLGIGLALVKGLIGLHDGTVEARSAGLGQGSEFTIHLPRVRIAMASGLSEPRHLPTDTDDVQYRIVIADDNRDAADSLAMLLEAQGHSVAVGYNGAEALKLVRATSPDVCILDIGMPDMTGYDVARSIRAEPSGRGICLIAITGWGQSEDRARSMSAGFDHHLTKPVDPEEVNRLLRTSRTSA
jgi:PAS domain S-box-containing protein